MLKYARRKVPVRGTIYIVLDSFHDRA
jgi:hypothetical protein